MRISILLASAALLAACSGETPDPTPVSTESDAPPAMSADELAMADLDCLAATTVVAITDAIRDGVQRGDDPATLTHIAPDETAAAVEKLRAKYGAGADTLALEGDINSRLEAFQNAMSNRDPDSIDTLTMNTTVELGRSCTFED